MSEVATAEQSVLDEARPTEGKSAVQKRFDQITRQKFEALREGEALRRENAELRNELQQAKGLLKDYRLELEKYRTKFIQFAAKEKHVRS